MLAESGIIIAILVLVIMIIEFFVLKRFFGGNILKQVTKILSGIANNHDIPKLDLLIEALEIAGKLRENTQDIEKGIHEGIDDIKKSS